MRLIRKPSNQFLRDYRLPLEATCLFAIILAVMLLTRTFERLALADVLGSNSSDLVALLSTDKTDEFKKNEVANQEKEATTTAAGTTTPFTVTPSPSPPMPPTGGTGDTGTNDPPPVEPFSAHIAGFDQTGQPVGPMLCGTTSGTGSNSMCKFYDFSSGVNTFNGPGTVAYSFTWAGSSNGPSGENEGSFSAGGGNGFTRLDHRYALRCDLPPGPYTFKFVLREPTAEQSSEIVINHYCGTAIPPSGP